MTPYLWASGCELEPGGQFVVGLKLLLDIDYDDTSASGRPFRLDTMFLGGTIGYRFDQRAFEEPAGD